MKIRSGFVSNSSSSSFVCFGAYVDYEIEDWEERERLEDQGIEFHQGEDGNVIGVDPDEMGLDETLRQFQTRIAEKISKACIKVSPSKLSFRGGTECN